MSYETVLLPKFSPDGIIIMAKEQFYKGPFKYYVIQKVGGWVRPNTYDCLQGGWVGVAKCLRNQKNYWIS